ncbi:MAG TPA: hypothetical protein VG013_17190 [Gemmataceae bacterium]|jgi:hypothetical protein|nr:hypothetical protein [Gemmataceae bacterium]
MMDGWMWHHESFGIAPVIRIRNPLWLPLLPATVCLADVALTLHGQPAAYWQGDYHSALEGNPLPRVFLEAHPLAFVCLVAGWVASVGLVALAAAPRWAAAGCLAVAAGHTVGAVSWLLRGRPDRLGLAVGLLFAVVALALPTWRLLRAAPPAVACE